MIVSPPVASPDLVLDVRRRPAQLLDVPVVAAMWRRELLRYCRDRSQWFGGVSRAILWLIILGYGIGASYTNIEGYTYTQFILPGVAALNIIFASMQSAIALVWDREVGLMREILVSPAPMPSVTLGKVLGGATVAVSQGTIVLLFAPLAGVALSPLQVLQAWAVMFAMGILLVSIGTVIASRMATFEGFGAISNGIVLPMYFLSGAVFPIRGIVGLGGFLVELPPWLKALMFINPVTYPVDLLRGALLSFQQLPPGLDLALAAALPLAALAAAVVAMNRLVVR
ncbi:MAG TPA: ABC transporter permease [bacterium]|nr:ABC transporter permease [bacterium]